MGEETTDNKEFQFTKPTTNNILSKTGYFMIYCFPAGLRGSSIIDNLEKIEVPKIF